MTYYTIEDGKLIKHEGQSPMFTIPEEPDKQFYDVTWYRTDPFHRFHEEGTWFEDFIKAIPSDKHKMEYPHPSNIGTAISARVAADSEEEAIAAFWKLWRYSPYASGWG